MYFSQNGKLLIIDFFLLITLFFPMVHSGWSSRIFSFPVVFFSRPMRSFRIRTESTSKKVPLIWRGCLRYICENIYIYKYKCVYIYSIIVYLSIYPKISSSLPRYNNTSQSIPTIKLNDAEIDRIQNSTTILLLLIPSLSSSLLS